MNKKTLVLIGIVMIILLAGGVVWYGNRGEEMPIPKDTPKLVVENINDVEEEKEEKKDVQPAYDFSEDLDVSKWATYKNEKVGVLVKYPKNWKIIELEDEKAGFALSSPVHISIQSGSVSYDSEIYIDDYVNPKKLSIKDLFQTFDDGSRLWFSQYNYENLKINNWNVVHFPEIDEEDREDFYVSANNFMYSFSYLYSTNQKNPIISQILRKIVENFEPIR